MPHIYLPHSGFKMSLGTNKSKIKGGSIKPVLEEDKKMELSFPAPVAKKTGNLLTRRPNIKFTL